MKSGISDWDDPDWVMNHPDQDIPPIDYLYNVPKKFLFKPGEGLDYTGTGVILLGFVLAQHAGVSSWDEYD